MRAGEVAAGVRGVHVRGRHLRGEVLRNDAEAAEGVPADQDFIGQGRRDEDVFEGGVVGESEGDGGGAVQGHALLVGSAQRAARLVEGETVVSGDVAGDDRLRAARVRRAAEVEGRAARGLQS